MPKLFVVFPEKLLAWYKANARDLPWRKTRDPYKIWLSEIILQQTTVRQGQSYYNKFVSTFPTIETLAAAPEDSVLKLWEGLGYYNRARNLLSTARYVVDNFGGVMPDNYHDLIQLKGVGPYTAAAIASFAFNLPHVVVDGNVLRVISRVFGIRKAIDNKKTVDTIKKIGQRMIIKNDPYSFNQAIMEFGAIRCVPKNPDCKTCVLKNECFAFTHHLVNTLPVKIKKQEKRIRFFQYTVLIDEENSTLVNRRKEKDIWRGLYEFPVRETSKADFDKYLAHEQFKEYHYSLVEVSRQYTQQLTHQTINSKFYKLILEKGVFLRKHKNLKKVSVHQLNKLAFPKTSCLYLSDNSITLVK